MWLDEIEKALSRTRRYAMMPEDMQRMARVLRELGEYARLNEIALLDNGLTLLHANRINLSNDAKELLHDNKDYQAGGRR